VGAVRSGLDLTTALHPAERAAGDCSGGEICRRFAHFVRYSGGFHSLRVLRYDPPKPRQPIGADFELRVWIARDSSRRKHAWREVPHLPPARSRPRNRPGERRAGGAVPDSLGLGDRIADTLCDANVDADADRGITDGDPHRDGDTHGDAAHTDSHGDADTHAAYTDPQRDADGHAERDTLGDADCDAHGDADRDTDGVSVTDPCAFAGSFSLLQGLDHEGLDPVHATRCRDLQSIQG
jgi:hypothetical protein